MLLQLRRFSQVAQILQKVVKRLTRISLATLRRQVTRQQATALTTAVQVLAQAQAQAATVQAHQVQVLQAQVQLSQVLKQLSFS